MDDTTHALYRFFNADRQLLYVGLTVDPGSRWTSHCKEKPWWHEVDTVKVETFPTRDLVIKAEREAIETEYPLYNIAHANTAQLDEARDCLAAIAAEHAKAMTQEAEIRETLRTAVRDAIAAGMTETEAARISGMSRVTVRTWIGKWPKDKTPNGLP